MEETPQQETPQQTRLREVWERFRATTIGTPEHDRLGDELVDILFANVPTEDV